MLPRLPDRYRPTRLLGEGATGMVYHAEDRLLELEVAVKVVRSNLALHRRFRARFAREVAISAQIAHPHVIPVHDTGVLDTGEPFVALGYAPGGSLSDLLRLRPPVGEVLRLLDQVLDALASLHARNLLHQDLKPSNVLLFPSGSGVDAWVADLGVADALSELTRDKKGISGTPGYMAPEQLQGRTQDLGPWTDLYAVGLILHETLSGTRPHPGEGRLELLEARLRPPPSLLDSGDLPIPEPLADLVRTLLDPDPRQRIDLAADVRRALRAAMQGQAFRGLARASAADPITSLTTDLVPILEEIADVLPTDTEPEGAVPRWNRVRPDPIPAQPPPESGWEAPARASLPLFALREVPLVGRERERKVLWDAAREVVALGEPRLVLLVGESGAGKSRLVRSVATALEEGGWMEAIPLRYHAPPGVDDGFRGAVRDLLVPWNDTRDGAEARLARWIARDRQIAPAEAREEAAFLARWCGYLRPGEPPVSEAVGLGYLYRHLAARAWRGGSCLVLEDVHNAVAAGDGLAIAEALLDRSVGDQPVLILATISAEALARDAALRRKVEGLQERGARRIGLARLTLSETRRVVQESLLLDPALAQVVSLECEGDPLTASLLLRDWAARKLLVSGPNGLYTLTQEVSLAEALPKDQDALLRRRVSAAIDAAADPSAAGEALAALALAGQQPPVALLRSFNDAGVDDLLATGILSERRGNLAFEHAYLQHVALELASRGTNAKGLHRRLAEAWESIGAALGMDIELQRGLHRLRAGEPDRALGALLDATRRMTQGGRARDAVRAGALAIEAADAVGEPRGRLAARRLHAEALLEAGEPERAIPLVERALSDVAGDRLEHARLHVLVGRAARKRGDATAAAESFDRAHTIFRATRDEEGLREVTIQRAKLARMIGEPRQAMTHWSEVLRLAGGNVAIEAEALNGLVEARVRAGEVTGIEWEMSRLQAVSRASGDTRRMADAAVTAAMLQLDQGGLDEAERLLHAAATIAATLGAERLLRRCRVLSAEVAVRRGDTDTADAINLWLARFCESRGLREEAVAAQLRVALLAIRRGDARQARAAVDAAADGLGHQEEHLGWRYIHLLRALLAAQEGDGDACREAWSRVGAHPLDLRAAAELEPVFRLLARAARAAGWEDLADSVEGHRLAGGDKPATTVPRP